MNIRSHSDITKKGESDALGKLLFNVSGLHRYDITKRNESQCTEMIKEDIADGEEFGTDYDSSYRFKIHT